MVKLGATEPFGSCANVLKTIKIKKHKSQKLFHKIISNVYLNKKIIKRSKIKKASKGWNL